ncbi:MAG: gas vesicle protein [Deltaproteobacteria bacterium]|nr:gas vesicle protein [Deltaproteobacteria bacterium]
MEPRRSGHATLVDLLDRILDKGIVIHADLMISVAGIPLIGVNLRAAVAGMETMLKYGMMTEWDEKTRSHMSREHAVQQIRLFQHETVIFKTLGAVWYASGIYSAWRYGHIYVTEKRLVICQRTECAPVFETGLNQIVAAEFSHRQMNSKTEMPRLNLVLKDDRVVMIRSPHMDLLRDALDQQAELHGYCLIDAASARDDDTETCPQCGRLAPAQTLLGDGCPRCGWMRKGYAWEKPLESILEPLTR